MNATKHYYGKKLTKDLLFDSGDCANIVETRREAVCRSLAKSRNRDELPVPKVAESLDVVQDWGAAHNERRRLANVNLLGKTVVIGAKDLLYIY